MTANELRLGNWVHSNFYGDYKIVGLSIFNEGNELYFKSLEYYPKSSKLKDLTPIPLSEEWLIKFGFNRRQNYFFLKKNSKYYFFWNEKDGAGITTYEKVVGDVVFDEITIIKKLKYVHELQNLYEILTGNELKLIDLSESV